MGRHRVKPSGLHLVIVFVSCSVAVKYLFDEVEKKAFKINPSLLILVFGEDLTSFKVFQMLETFS